MSKPTRLRQILKDEGITQEMLAEWSGLHVNTIGHWVRGEGENMAIRPKTGY